MLRDAAISLSLANICFVKVWGKALSGAGVYFNEFPIAYAAIVADVLLLAAVFFVAITIVRRSPNATLRKLARGAFLLAILTVLNGIGLLFLTLSSINFSALMGRNLAWFAGLGLTTAMVFVAVKARARIIHFAPRVILVLLPFAVITFSQAVWKLTRNTGVVYAESEPLAHAPIARRTPARACSG